MRGFVQEMLSLAGWILAIFAIRYLHTDLTVWLSGYIGISTGTVKSNTSRGIEALRRLAAHHAPTR